MPPPTSLTLGHLPHLRWEGIQEKGAIATFPTSGEGEGPEKEPRCRVRGSPMRAFRRWR